MNQVLTLDVHYYQQFKASVRVTSENSSTRSFAELVLFNCYALRQMSNLGDIGATAANLLTLVTSYPEDIENYLSLIQSWRTIPELAVNAPLLGALGVDLKNLIKYTVVPEIVMGRVSLGTDYQAIKDAMWPDVVELVEPRIVNGKHRFLCSLNLSKERALFELKPHGFGILGKAVNWYALTSIMIVYRHFLASHAEDNEFRNKLAKCANQCGKELLKGKVNAFSLLTAPIDIATGS